MKALHGATEQLEQRNIGRHSAHASTRYQALRAFSDITGRNTVAYYSGWLQKRSKTATELIERADNFGIMECLRGIDKTKGLDLVLHLPGGSLAAVETAILGIREQFKGNVRVFVPECILSSGSILSFLGKEIWMGNYSSLGQVAPMHETSFDTPSVAELEYQKAHVGGNLSFDTFLQSIVGLKPMTIRLSEREMSWSTQLAKEALRSGMFNSNHRQAVEVLRNFKAVLRSHGAMRNLSRRRCREIGLTIRFFEDDWLLHGLILQIHRAFINSFLQSDEVKIIQNDQGAIYSRHTDTIQMDGYCVPNNVQIGGEVSWDCAEAIWNN